MIILQNSLKCNWFLLFFCKFLKIKHQVCQKPVYLEVLRHLIKTKKFPA